MNSILFVQKRGKVMK